MKKHIPQIFDDQLEQQFVRQKNEIVSHFHLLSFDEALHYYRDLLLRSTKQNVDDTDRFAASYELKCINESMGLHYVKHSAVPFSKEERLIIRMDFYGTIDRIPNDERKKKLSRHYLYGIKQPLTQALPISCYDLKKSPSWRLYARFEKFRRIEGRLRQYMAQSRFNPHLLEVMTPRDFSDLIVQAFAKSPKDNKVIFEYPLSTRKRFIKKLAQKHHKEIYKILASKYDERWAKSVVQMMRRYGSVNQSKLVICEIYWTPRIISDLKARGINTEAFKVGTKIPKRIMDSAFDMGLEKYFVARDSNGFPLRASSFPSFDVHHKHPVCLVGELTDIQRANYEGNLCLVLSDLHTQVLHGKDGLTGGQGYEKRLEFIDKNTAFMAGFDLKDQISVDFSNDPQILARAQEDKKYACSFDECMKELSDNGAACPKLYRKSRMQKKAERTNGSLASKQTGHHDLAPKKTAKTSHTGNSLTKLIMKKMQTRGFRK